MNDIGTLAKALAEVTALWEAEKYDRALKRVEELRKSWPGNSQVHIWFAKLVQLQEQPTHTLNDAKRALQQAVELDKQSPAAAIELGYFLDNVEDDPQAAAKAFAQGIAAARHLLIEGLLGQAHSLLQLDKREQAVRCLVEAHQLADSEPHSTKGQFTERIDELLRELGQMQTA
jgi:predicted Zn-dependent protease